ncbi:hypothetical protein OG317_36760 [Streptomyces sp. NBC_01167]|nr:hypothetical protein OG317_36760 [Streptomyces sp. NBC_01167]
MTAAAEGGARAEEEETQRDLGRFEQTLQDTLRALEEAQKQRDE